MKEEYGKRTHAAERGWNSISMLRRNPRPRAWPRRWPSRRRYPAGSPFRGMRSGVSRICRRLPLTTRPMPSWNASRPALRSFTHIPVIPSTGMTAAMHPVGTPQSRHAQCLMEIMDRAFKEVDFVCAHHTWWGKPDKGAQADFVTQTKLLARSRQSQRAGKQVCRIRSDHDRGQL